MVGGHLETVSCFISWGLLVQAKLLAPTHVTRREDVCSFWFSQDRPSCPPPRVPPSSSINRKHESARVPCTLVCAHLSGGRDASTHSPNLDTLHFIVRKE